MMSALTQLHSFLKESIILCVAAALLGLGASAFAAPAMETSDAGSTPDEEMGVCNQPVHDLATSPGTLILWLPGGAKNLPDLGVLRNGDVMMVKAHTVDEALDEISALRTRITELGGTPNHYRYLVRTFPSDLSSGPAENQEPPFFAGASTEKIEKLHKFVLALMFDHERAWYDRDPARLPAWNWNYDWTMSQVSRLAKNVNAHCFLAGALVTPAGETKWIGHNGRPPENGFGKLLNTPETRLNYLIVQAQPKCRENQSGDAYGAFASKLASEVAATFPGDRKKLKVMAAQISIDEDVHANKKENYVPPEWAQACLRSASSLSNEDEGQSRARGARQINGFFLWSANKTAVCETISKFRGPRDFSCK